MNTEQYMYILTKAIAPHICWIHPNVITGIGFLLTPVIWFLLKQKNAPALIITVTVFRGFLDCLDGTLARLCDRMTPLGAWLDIMSDFIFGVMIYTITVTHLLRDITTLRWYTVGIILVSTWVIIRMAELVYLRGTGRAVTQPQQDLQWLHNNSTLGTTIIIYGLYCFLQWK